MKKFIFLTLFLLFSLSFQDFFSSELDARPGGGGSYRSSSSSSSSSSFSSGGSGGGGDIWTVGLVILSIVSFASYNAATDYNPNSKTDFKQRVFFFALTIVIMILAGICVRFSMLATAAFILFMLFCPIYIYYKGIKLLTGSRETIYVAKSEDNK
ncbi:MAG: hypothetical protein KDK36_04945 [Leptospiraceae bacterium]|nr:hypothetical protein [Leptospiraceae bacterium]